MKVLVATHATQGTIDDDFSHCTEGELVHLPLFVCHSWDGPCGCGRSFCGTASHRAGTSAKVVERADLNEGQVRTQVAASPGGWGTDPELLGLCLDPILDIVRELEIGTILGFRVTGSDNDPEPPEHYFFDRQLAAVCDAINAMYGPRGRQ